MMDTMLGKTISWRANSFGPEGRGEVIENWLQNSGGAWVLVVDFADGGLKIVTDVFDWGWELSRFNDITVIDFLEESNEY